MNQDGKDAELPQIEWLAYCEDEWERDGSLPRIVYTPHPDVTSETETEILASVYRYVMQCLERREAAGKVGGDENVPEAGHTGEQPKEGHAEHAQEAEVFEEEVLDNDY